MNSKGSHYGLNLDRGLQYRGLLTEQQAGLLGAYTTAIIAYSRDMPINVTIKGLVGNICAYTATNKTKLRILSKSLVIGDFCLTALDYYDASIDVSSTTSPHKLTAEGVGILHIPETSLYERYEPLLPDRGYLTDGSQTSDRLKVEADQYGLDFTIDLHTKPPEA